MKMFFKTLNKRQCVPYLYTCKLNKMAVPLLYPYNEQFFSITYYHLFINYSILYLSICICIYVLTNAIF